MATIMISPKKEIIVVTESVISSTTTTTQPDTRKSAVEELRAKVSQFLERERLIIEGKVPPLGSDAEDSDDGELLDPSAHRNQKGASNSIQQDCCEDSTFYQSDKYQCEWIGCQFQTGKHRKFMVHSERHAAKVDRDNDGFKCNWQLCDFSAKSKDDFVGHVHHHAYHTKLKMSGARLVASLNIPVCVYRSDNRNNIPNNTNYKCSWRDCRMRFNKIMDFGFHVDSHYSDLYAISTNARKKPPKCQWSGCKCKSIRKLCQAKIHAQKHTGPRFIACHNCGHTFIRRDLLIQHCLRRLALCNSSKSNYKCHEIGCSMEFIRKSTLERHIGTHYNRPTSDYDSKHLKRKHNVSSTPGKTSENDSNDEESASGGTPIRTVNSPKVDPKEPTHTSPRKRTHNTLLNYFSSATTAHRGTSGGGKTVTRGVKRRRSELELLNI
uniref:Uncharacterized protein n=1 Tax=Anopheles darlingi TaxID=43151 RepID=A0A2K6VB48_ANODA